MVPNFFSSKIFFLNIFLSHNLYTFSLSYFLCVFVCLFVCPSGPLQISRFRRSNKVLVKSPSTCFGHWWHNSWNVLKWFKLFSVFWSTKIAVTSKSSNLFFLVSVHWCACLLGLENPMVDTFVQLNTKHSCVELT